MSGSGGAPYWIAYAGSWRPNDGPVDSRVDGQPNNYRERMAMFGLHDASAAQGTREQVPKGVEVKNKDDETADIKGKGEEKAEEEEEKKEEKHNRTVDTQGKGEEKGDESVGDEQILS